MTSTQSDANTCPCTCGLQQTMIVLVILQALGFNALAFTLLPLAQTWKAALPSGDRPLTDILPLPNKHLSRHPWMIQTSSIHTLSQLCNRVTSCIALECMENGEIQGLAQLCRVFILVCVTFYPYKGNVRALQIPLTFLPYSLRHVRIDM